MTPAAALKQARECLAECDRHLRSLGWTVHSIPAAIAAIDALGEDGWIVWKQDDSDDEGEYPPDETDVEIYCGHWQSKDRLIGRTSRARGTGGPSGASHWRRLAPPPEPPQ